MAARCRWLPLTVLAVGSLALAADDDVPEAAFIEYLGMWEESDEDWMMFENESKTADEDEESAENDDED